jgi:hypothetical protein
MTTTLTRRLFGASLAALSAAAMPGLAQAAQKAAKAKGDKPLYKDPAQPIDARVQDLLARMTLEEKAAQLIGIWLTKNKIQTLARAGQQELPQRPGPDLASVRPQGRQARRGDRRRRRRR